MNKTDKKILYLSYSTPKEYKKLNKMRDYVRKHKSIGLLRGERLLLKEDYQNQQILNNILKENY